VRASKDTPRRRTRPRDLHDNDVRSDREAASRHHRRQPVRRRIFYFYYYYYYFIITTTHKNIVRTRERNERVLRIILYHPSGDPRRGARRTIGKLSHCPIA